MDNNYKKYLKYKEKYLTLLFTINYIQDGGKSKRSAPKLFGSNLHKKGLAPNEDIPNGIKLDNEGMVYEMNSNYGIYFCDRLRKYKFECNGLGLILLKYLISVLKLVLKKNNELLKDKTLEEIKIIKKKGYELYDEKPMLKKSRTSGKPGTWSNEEYGFIGFQWMYLRYKSYQRFTETWALLERCLYGGLMKFDKTDLQIVSLGGGPGFELLAFDLFMRHHINKDLTKPLINMDYVSLDLQPGWEIYVKELGILILME